MKDLLNLLTRVTPEVISALKERHDILNFINSYQPIGRRTLAAKLGQNERKLRKELDFLRGIALLDVGSDGVFLTQKGEGLLTEMQPYVRELLGLYYLEEALAQRFKLSKAIIVPGDSDADEMAFYDIGRAAAQIIKEVVTSDSIIAVTGGGTVARVTELVQGLYLPGVTVVPARGGLGEQVETQADTIAAKLAKNLGGRYKLLHIPENVDPPALKALLADGRIQKMVDIIKKADILLYGVGRAEVMAQRRGLPPQRIEGLLKRGAVAEALGHYFDERGEIVETVPSLGLEPTDMPLLSLALVVAGGSSKADALAAALKKGRGQVLVTDEGAARGMMD